MEMTRKTIDSVTLEVTRGDIAHQPDIDAVVNAANAELRTGGGVAGALHWAAGPGLEQECRPLAPIRPGEAVLTGAHNLPNRYVIHCLGPIYGQDEPPAELLANCYRNALRRAEENGVGSIAFPAISTGIFGFPKEPAARIALQTVRAELLQLRTLTRIRFVQYSSEDEQLYIDLL